MPTLKLLCLGEETEEKLKEQTEQQQQKPTTLLAFVPSALGYQSANPKRLKTTNLCDRYRNLLQVLSVQGCPQNKTKLQPWRGQGFHGQILEFLLFPLFSHFLNGIFLAKKKNTKGSFEGGHNHKWASWLGRTIDWAVEAEVTA